MGVICSWTKVFVKSDEESEIISKKIKMLMKNRFKYSIEEMTKLYTITDIILGEGAFGKVYLAESNLNTDIKFAVKVVQKSLITKEQIRSFREVWNWIKTLDHPGVLKYYSLFENDDYFYLVMEYFKGKQLLDVIITNWNITNPFLLELKTKEILK